MEDNKYYLQDYESGELYEVTKEQWEQHNRMMLSFYSVLNEGLYKGLYKGKVIVYGTAGELDGTEALEKLFNQPVQGYETPVFDANVPKGYFTPKRDNL